MDQRKKQSHQPFELDLLRRSLNGHFTKKYVCFSSDYVAKVESCMVTNFSRKRETIADSHRSNRVVEVAREFRVPALTVVGPV
jgi:hypothetical protein